MATDVWDPALKRVSSNLDVFVILMLVFLMIYFFVLELFNLTLGRYGIIVGAMIDGFLLGWYVSALYQANSYISTNKKVNYINSITDGFNDFVALQSVMVAVVGLVLIGGILNAVAGGGLLGAVLEGILMSIATATALTSLSPHSRGPFNFEIISEINEASPDSGLFLYATILVSIIPVLGLLQLVALPIACSIISLRQMSPSPMSKLQTGQGRTGHAAKQ